MRARRLRAAGLKIDSGDPKLARYLHPVIATRRGRPMEHRITVFAGAASSQLGAAVCNALQVAPGLYECRRFPDGETQIDVHESVRGRDVYLLQSTSPPVDQHVMESLLLADACRRAGAARLTAIVPSSGTPGRTAGRDVAHSARVSRHASLAPADSIASCSLTRTRPRSKGSLRCRSII
jgi:hypothetical protein